MDLQRSGVQKLIGVVGTDLSMPMTAAHIQGSVQVVGLAQKKGAVAPVDQLASAQAIASRTLVGPKVL